MNERMIHVSSRQGYKVHAGLYSEHKVRFFNSMQVAAPAQALASYEVHHNSPIQWAVILLIQKHT